MSEPLFIETMRVEAGAIANIDMHIQRMLNTCAEVFNNTPDLERLNTLIIPSDAQKCRIVYGRDIKSIEFSNYTPRTISSLKLVEAPSSLDYHLKYEDRSKLNELVALREQCDEVLIVKDGYITDTSFSNVVFTDGEKFVTPNTCLLAGTMRSKLISDGIITEQAITPTDIQKFTHIALINAMLPLDLARFIPVKNIY